MKIVSINRKESANQSWRNFLFADSQEFDSVEETLEAACQVGALWMATDLEVPIFPQVR